MLEESSSRTRRAFVWVSTGLSLLVVATCFATSESVADGAAEATRWSARFSGLVAAVALGARASRPFALSRWRTELTLAFVAAHGVHFATVVLRALVEPESKLRSFRLDVILVVLAGVILLAVIAGTARATTRAGRRANAFAFYVAWTVLALASASRARTSPASAVVLGALSAAMAWRIGSRVTEARVTPAAASGAPRSGG